jgi:predicted RNase H-like nuclease
LRTIAGVDGFRGQWLSVQERPDGLRDIEFISSFAELIARDEIDLFVIDIPIGLPDTGARSCDLLARRALGPRRSSVFPAPIRPMLDATSYRDASSRRYAVEGKRCSKQLYGILSLVRDVNSQMTPALQRRVREGHPELSFTLLNGGVPLASGKGTPDGRRERVTLLEPFFPEIEQLVAQFDPRAAVPDLLDAYALLWTARRLLEERANRYPDNPENDGYGLAEEIIA